MGANWENISIIMICVNIFLYIGSSSSGLSLVQGDALEPYFVSEFNQTQLMDDASDSNLRINNSIINVPEQITAKKGVLDSVLQLLDPLEVVFGFIKTIFNFLFVPLILFKIEGIPYVIAFMIAIPLTMAFWFSFIRLVRSG